MLRCIILAALGILSVLGRAPQKIMGGEEVRSHEFSFMASLQVNGVHICGGSIISSSHVLTAAHCVVKLSRLVHGPLVVVTGTDSPYSGGEVHAVKIAHYHGGYNASDPSSPDDIAIIELEMPIKFNNFQKRIRIATSLVKEASKATVIGWGFYDHNQYIVSHKLRKVMMETLRPGPCQLFIDTQLWTHQLCAMNYPGYGTCLGDSGGPLIYKDELIAVISYGAPCATGLPDVFTSIYHYRHWIKNIVGTAISV